MQNEPRHSEVRRRANAWTTAGACCFLSLFALPLAASWSSALLRLSAFWSVVMLVALSLLWLGAGIHCLHRARMMLVLGTPEEREARKRDFQRSVE